MFLTAEQRKKLMSALAGGLFVTCGKEKPNIMTTHWGALGAFWHKQVFVLPVRAGKRSHEILAETGSFAVSVPTTDMRNEIMLCDTMSGRKQIRSAASAPQTCPQNSRLCARRVRTHSRM